MVDLYSHDNYFRELEEQRQLSMGQITTQEIETSFARQKFMIALSYIAPDCLDSLKLIYKNNYSLLAALLNKTVNNFPASIDRILPFYEGVELFRLLENWSNEWNINEEWIIENALIAILSWFNKPELIDELYWYNNPEKHGQAIARGIQAKMRMERDADYAGKYDPFIHHSKKEFLKLNKNREKENQLLAKYGLKRTVKKDQRHFEWLVQYQLLHYSTEEIAQLVINDKSVVKDIMPESIKKAIKQTAKLVGIKT